MGNLAMLLFLSVVMVIQYLFLGFEITALGWICVLIWLKLREDYD